MTTFIKKTRSLFISLAIALSAYVFSIGAHAGLIYNGYADIEFSLVNVARAGGPGEGNGEGSGPGVGLGPGENSYSVTLSGSLFDSDSFSSGSGFADFFTSILPSGDWSVDTSVYQFSESDGGSSGNSSASSYADTDFSILFQSNHQNSLLFDLSFLSYISAFISNDTPLVSGDDAGAYGEIQLFDDDNEIFFSSAEAFVGGSMFSSKEIEQSIRFELEGYESYEISGIVYSDGYAVTVPEPSTLWLMALGLITMIVRNNYQRSNTSD